ncbi:similar to U79 of HHV6, GenBank Accession Number X83413 at the C-terminus, partial [Human betaherpesvirus 7]
CLRFLHKHVFLDASKEKRMKVHHEKRHAEEQANEEVASSSQLSSRIPEGALSPTISIDLQEYQEFEDFDKRICGQVGGVLGL